MTIQYFTPISTNVRSRLARSNDYTDRFSDVSTVRVAVPTAAARSSHRINQQRPDLGQKRSGPPLDEMSFVPSAKDSTPLNDRVSVSYFKLAPHDRWVKKHPYFARRVYRTPEGGRNLFAALDTRDASSRTPSVSCYRESALVVRRVGRPHVIFSRAALASAAISGYAVEILFPVPAGRFVSLSVTAEPTADHFRSFAFPVTDFKSDGPWFRVIRKKSPDP